MLPTKHKSNWRTSLHVEPERVRTIIKEKNQTGEPPCKLNLKRLALLFKEKNGCRSRARGL